MTDPFYRKTMAPSGNIVSGAAAFMVHTKNAGGPSKMMRDIAIMAGEAGGQKVLDRLDAPVTKRPGLRLVKNA